MTARLRQVVRKRELLVALIREQRAQLALEAMSVQRSLAFADLAWRGYRRIKSSPLIGAAIAAALVTLGPGKFLKIGYRSGLFALASLRMFKGFRSLR